MKTTRLFSLLFPLLAAVVSTYKLDLIKAHRTRQHLKFLKKCHSEQVLPKSLLPYRLRNVSDHPFSEFSVIILKKHIQQTTFDEKKCFKKLSFSKWNFACSVPENWKNPLMDKIYGELRTSITNLEGRLDEKLKYLIRESAWTTQSNPNSVINMSSKNLDDNAITAMGFGLSFAVNKPPSAASLSTAFCQLEKFGNVPVNNLNIAKGLVYQCVSDTAYQPNIPARFLKSINNLKKDEEIVVTKADKSNAFVILDKHLYNNKMEELLSDSTTYKQLKKNPLEEVIKTFNSKLKKILKNQRNLIEQFSVSAPRLPYLYGVVKTHKQNSPMRPIISSVGSITYKLSKYLVKLLSPLLGKISDSHVINSFDLINKINNINVTPDMKMVSFDVCSLFTKVPINSVLDYLRNELNNHQLDLSTNVIIQLVELCIADCKFVFNGKFFQQTFGMAMGNPLSPVLSNLYMEFFEKEYLHTLTNTHLYWYRYVDDILCFVPNNFDIHEFLSRLNNLVSSIKFTMEMEENNCLPFLDVMLHRENFSVKYSIYRKPTNNLSYVHFFSAHEEKIKKSIFITMFLRALRIVSPEFLEAETSLIKEIGKNLCYPDWFLDNCLCTARRIFHKPRIEPNIAVNFKNVLVLPFFNGCNNLKRHMKTLDIKVVFKYESTLKNLLIKNTPNSDSNIVYKIPCRDCNKYYIGQTSKCLDTRVSQHKYNVRRACSNSALFLHYSSSNHQINWRDSSIVVRCSNIVTRNLIESALITLKKDSTINQSTGIYILDNVILQLFSADFKNIISNLT